MGENSIVPVCLVCTEEKHAFLALKVFEIIHIIYMCQTRLILKGITCHLRMLAVVCTWISDIHQPESAGG